MTEMLLLSLRKRIDISFVSPDCLVKIFKDRHPIVPSFRFRWFVSSHLREYPRTEAVTVIVTLTQTRC